MQQRTIIDGQQRLTTLQLLLDALQAELAGVGATQPAERLQQLVANGRAFCTAPEDCFKVWPTNRDRPAFNDVMGATPPVDHDGLAYKGSRMVEAHRYFGGETRAWLAAGGPEQVSDRAAAIDATVRDLLQLVVIDLAADENAQEIFETLNARGAQLTAADLIKNFIFQRLLEATAAVEVAYDKHWKDFETAFWETEISVGRLRYHRSSTFSITGSSPARERRLLLGKYSPDSRRSRHSTQNSRCLPCLSRFIVLPASTVPLSSKVKRRLALWINSRSLRIARASSRVR
jgi:hypothetical protein